MPFLIFGLFVIAVSIISAFRKRHERLSQDVERKFWDREAAANSVRRQDISGLPYITIPSEIFSIGSVSDDVIANALHSLESLQEKKILNLAGQSNTDLKMQYGPANLPSLMEYDQNYTDMLLAITNIANRLVELEQTELAIPALEFTISTGTDISTHYTILATYYKNSGQQNKIADLKEHAEKLDSLMKQSIIQKITAIETAS